MKQIEINSRIEISNEISIEVTDNDIHDEPMLFQCDYENALEKGGRITREVLAKVPVGWKQDVVIDSRSHMLMQGWYPCIPGWHHDDVPRNTFNGQPNYTNPDYISEHLLFLINADVAPTQFALGSGSFTLPDGIIYKEWDKVVSEMVERGELITISAPDRSFVYFDDRSWHRGVKATKFGWRWFIRISRFFDAKTYERIPRPDKRANQTRKQVQVYLESVNDGW